MSASIAADRLHVAPDRHADDGVVAAVQHVQVGATAQGSVTGETAGGHLARRRREIDRHVELGPPDLARGRGKTRPVVADVQHDETVRLRIGHEEVARRHPVEDHALAGDDVGIGRLSRRAVDPREGRDRSGRRQGVYALLYVDLNDAAIGLDGGENRAARQIG